MYAEGGKVHSLREPYLRILKTLSLHPEGIPLAKIQEEAKLSSLTNAYAYCTKLIKKEYIRKEKRLYFLNDAGLQYLQEPRALGQGKPSSSQDSTKLSGAVSQLPPAHQRMHAIQAQARLYRTSYDRIEAILTTLGIAFKKTSLKPAQYILEWKGIKLKATRHKLIAYGKEINAPLEIRGEDLDSIALSEAGAILYDFLEKTNLRVQRDLNNNIILRLRYWEVAFTDNELARRATEHGGFIPIAFDRATGHATLWFDHSFTHEAETNKDHLRRELGKWGQAMQDEITHPYDDEMRHRQEIRDIDQRLDRTTIVLEEYGIKLTAHIPVLEKMNIVQEQQIELNKKLLAQPKGFWNKLRWLFE